MSKLRICLAGVTGWTGRAIAAGIVSQPDLELVSGVARTAAGKSVEEAIGLAGAKAPIFASVAEALAKPADVLIDYTSSKIVKQNALLALGRGVPVVIGTSGLTAGDFQEIAAAAKDRGVIASGNFSITAALATRFALLAAAHLPRWEITEYAPAKKHDVPSGTVRELAERLSGVRTASTAGTAPLDPTSLNGPTEARGAAIGGGRVHSVRMDSFVSSFEVMFGLPNERLTLRHDSGTGAEPYVGGTLMAARKVGETRGLVRGLDTLIFG